MTYSFYTLLIWVRIFFLKRREGLILYIMKSLESLIMLMCCVCMFVLVFGCFLTHVCVFAFCLLGDRHSLSSLASQTARPADAS